MAERFGLGGGRELAQEDGKGELGVSVAVHGQEDVVA